MSVRAREYSGVRAAGVRAAGVRAAGVREVACEVACVRAALCCGLLRWSVHVMWYVVMGCEEIYCGMYRCCSCSP